MQKTKVIKQDDNKPKWYLIDVKGENLGKVAVRIAAALMGKQKLEYTPNLFSGDNIIVINAKDIRVSPKKHTDKLYHKHSGYPGGLTTLSFDRLMSKNPSAVIKNAVKGMIPKTKMGDKMLSHLYVYNGPDNPHHGQNPIILK